LSYKFTGTRYDCGGKAGYLMANVAFALKHPEIKKDFTGYIQSLLPE